jgi:hypothetical protein
VAKKDMVFRILIPSNILILYEQGYIVPGGSKLTEGKPLENSFEFPAPYEYRKDCVYGIQ